VAHPGLLHDEPGGPEAQASMQELVEDRTVVCALTDERTLGGCVGTCMVDGHDIGRELIEDRLQRVHPELARFVRWDPAPD
jgi:endonuclease YncB( thermonuclease family)